MITVITQVDLAAGTLQTNVHGVINTFVFDARIFPLGEAMKVAAEMAASDVNRIAEGESPERGRIRNIQEGLEFGKVKNAQLARDLARCPEPGAPLANPLDPEATAEHISTQADGEQLYKIYSVDKWWAEFLVTRAFGIVRAVYVAGNVSGVNVEEFEIMAAVRIAAEVSR